MIAFIRASFPGTPSSAVWSDTMAHDWMNPTVPFSLAHFWKVSTFHQIDLTYHLFPPVELDDPRRNQPDDRIQLVRAVLLAVDEESHPDWDLFDRCIIYFAQKTDMFGGGAHYAPNQKLVAPAVFDLLSPFNGTCQEVGHAFGLHHELSPQMTEYGCPYSVMSASANDLSFFRAPDPRLPGVAGPTHPQRQVGPYVPAVHLYLNQYGAVNPKGVFNHADSVTYVPATYEHTPYSMRLWARDAAIAAWPKRRRLLAVLPPIVPGGDTHFLEVRRTDASYDGGIGNACITICAANVFAGSGAVADLSAVRIRYIDRIDLEGVEGDLDYHSFGGRFVVRVNSYDDDFESVDVTIAGGNAWQNFAVALDDPQVNRKQLGTSDWHMATVAPCPIWPKREYSYQYRLYETFHVFQAHSSGYEKPSYVWYLGSERLDPAGSLVTISVPCRDANGHEINPPVERHVSCNFKINRGRLEFNVSDAFADITIPVRVVVNESSPEVMKNYYPERSIFTTVRIDNLEIVWDEEFRNAATDCLKAMRDANTKLKEQILVKDPKRDPRPPWEQKITLPDLIRNLAERDQHAAFEVASEVAKAVGMPTDVVLDEVFRRSAGQSGPVL